LIQEKAGELESGAGIPAGIDDVETGLYADLTAEEKVLINKDFSEVPGMIRAFRQWMKDRGQQNKPLIISEMAVMMPDWIMPGEFTPEKIRDEFLYFAIDYIFNEKDPNLGYPLDDNRLVQSMWWWSFDKDFGRYEDGEFLQAYGGNLAWTGGDSPPHAPMPKGISELGTYWAAKTSTMPNETNIYPLSVSPGAATSFYGESVDVTVTLKIVNSGNVAVNTPFLVRYSREGTSEVLHEEIVNSRLEGCGEVFALSVVIPNLSPGVHNFRAVIDALDDISEVNGNDNEIVFSILVAPPGLRLPIIIR
jgi:hypothetical protein